MPRTMGSEYRHRVIRIDVTVISHFTHLNMRFTGFLALLMRSWFPTIIPKRGCALYTKLRPIHRFKGLDKGCVLYMGASYTREITVIDFFFFHWFLLWHCLKILQYELFQWVNTCLWWYKSEYTWSPLRTKTEILQLAILGTQFLNPVDKTLLLRIHKNQPASLFWWYLSCESIFWKLFHIKILRKPALLFSFKYMLN